MRIGCLGLLVLIGLLSPTGPVHAGEGGADLSDPCSGRYSLLSLLDRPTFSDSVCVVPEGKVVLEAGFQHIKLTGPGSGVSDNYPLSVLRIGVPGRNEIVFLPPGYNRQSSPDDSVVSGTSAVTIGIKHGLGYNRLWTGAVEALLTLPTGSSSFGSQGFGLAFNGIVSYALSDQAGISLQLGISSQTTPGSAGGERFTSIVSGLAATWQTAGRLQFYGEVFGQSSTGPGEGAGYIANGGLQYLITPAWEVDIEEGIRLTGNFNGISHFYGAGTGFRF